MAFKKYAYYNKGNKFALVEAEMSSSGGNLAVAHCTISGYTTKDTCEAAGGQWIPSSGGVSGGTWEKYVSPKESISGGLEVEYSYSPTFNIQSKGLEGVDFHRFLGWGSNGSNLLLFTFGATGVDDLSSKFAADDWIYIENSGRWSGLHQVKSTGSATGILTLKTKCNLPAANLYDVSVSFGTDETVSGDSAANDMDIETFKDQTSSRATRYVFIEGVSQAANAGLFSLSSDDTVGQLTFNTKYTIDADGDYTDRPATLASEAGVTPTGIYNAFYEQIKVRENIEVLQDESFELDLTEYQSQGVVYYVKAKIAEDLGDFERREFFMRLFKKQIEKASGARKRGPYIVQGFSGMRK